MEFDRLPQGPNWTRRTSAILFRYRSTPTFAVYAFQEPPSPAPWDYRWVLWPDFGLPWDDHDAAGAFSQAWERAADERVEVACWGGMGRTGTVLACLAILDGLPAVRTVSYVRENYHSSAVETPHQVACVARFTAP